MAYKFFNIIWFFMIISHGYPQNTQIPELTKSEMKEDIDFLYRIIMEVCPNLTIRQKVTGTKLYAELDSLWNCVATIGSFEDFYYLATQMLILCQDQHNDFQTFYPEEERNKSHFLMSEAIEISKTCKFQYDKYFPGNSMGIIYIDGEYFFPENVFNIETNEIIIPFSAKLLRINNIFIDDYINLWNRKNDNSIRWDFERMKYYTYRLYQPYFTGLSENEYNITYSLNGSIRTVNMEDIYSGIHGWRCKGLDDAKVLYFSEKSILYIRIPTMDFQQIDYLKTKILENIDKNIKKVILDIRSNGGGNDLVWMNILSVLIDKPIIVNEKMCFKNTPLVKDYLKNIREMEIDTTMIISIEGEEFIDYSFNDTINPSQESIHYKGNIYVLVNEHCFSSALAFSAFCNKTDQLITIGQPTNYIGGRGITPFFFILPNSRLIFEVNPTLDAANAKLSMDYYDNYVKIPVPLTIHDYNCELKYEGERYGKEFLFYHDSIFKTVLSIDP